MEFRLGDRLVSRFTLTLTDSLIKMFLVPKSYFKNYFEEKYRKMYNSFQGRLETWMERDCWSNDSCFLRLIFRLILDDFEDWILFWRVFFEVWEGENGEIECRDLPYGVEMKHKRRQSSDIEDCDLIFSISVKCYVLEACR